MKQSRNKHPVLKTTLALIAFYIALSIYGSAVDAADTRYEEIIDICFTSYIEERDAKTLYSLFPEDSVAVCLNRYDLDLNDVIGEYQERLDENTKKIDEELGDWKVSYTIDDVYTPKVYEMSMFQKAYQYYFGVSYSSKKDIWVTAKFEGEKEGSPIYEKESILVTVVKIKGEWYLWGLNGGTIADFFAS